MSWSPKQMKLFRAVVHGWHKPGGGGPSVKAAKKMEHEGTRKERGAKRKKHLDKWARGEREHSNVGDYKT